MEYKLKDGRIINSIPIGKSNFKIGEINESGYLTICDRGPNSSNSKKRGAQVICKCKCGNYTLISLQQFRNGGTKSCGCYNVELHKKLCKKIGEKSHYKDYTKFYNPFYTFIKPIGEKDKQDSIVWEIECKQCKKHYFVAPNQLISDTRRKGNNPCKCWHASKGVLKIQQLLNENRINYITEKTFEGCISPSGYNFKFDFYLTDLNILIEYDGEQHFSPQSFGDTKETGEEKLNKTKLYDTLKNNWCNENNIKLIRIPYTDYNFITIDDLLYLNKYIANGSD